MSRIEQLLEIPVEHDISPYMIVCLEEALVDLAAFKELSQQLPQKHGFSRASLHLETTRDSRLSVPELVSEARGKPWGLLDVETVDDFPPWLLMVVT